MVDPEWLMENLGAPGLVILDASWYLPKHGRDPRAEFEDAHIPTARFFNVDACADLTSGLPHTVPSPEAFSAFVASLGITNESRVVLYDGSGTNLSAPRVWWLFRYFGHEDVAVLDGGWSGWLSVGGTTESGEAHLSQELPAPFLTSPQPHLIRDASAVRLECETGGAQVVDMRSRGRFEGTEPEPRPGLRGGHMPGSLSLPFTDLVDPEGKVWPLEELRSLLASAGINIEEPVVGTCGSGTSACALALNLARLGRLDVAIYDGSWAEWGQDNGLPVVTGQS